MQTKFMEPFFLSAVLTCLLFFGLFLALCFSLFVLYSASGQEIDMLTDGHHKPVQHSC